MPTDTDPTLPFVTTTAALPREGEGLVDQSDVIAIQRRKIATLWGEIEKRDHELAKRDDLIAHYKIGEAGWQEEAKGLEAKVRNLRANLDDFARRNVVLGERTSDQGGDIARLTTELAHAEEAIADLRAHLARAGEIEEAAKTLMGNVQRYHPYKNPDTATVRLCDYDNLRAALAAPSPSPGAAEAIGDAFGEDASEEEEAFVEGLPVTVPINREWLARFSKAMEKVAGSYSGGNYATLFVSDLIDVWDEADATEVRS